MNQSDIGEHAAEGGHAKQANREARAATLIESLPPLNKPDAPEQWLNAAARGAGLGCIPGAQAGAIVRAVEVELRRRALAIDASRLKELEERSAQLERELAQLRQRRRAG